jgi:hypothetical protein
MVEGDQELLTETGFQTYHMSTCNHFGPSGQSTTDFSMLRRPSCENNLQITVTRFSMLWSLYDPVRTLNRLFSHICGLLSKLSQCRGSVISVSIS